MTHVEAHARAIAELEHPPSEREVANVTERHAHMAAIATADMVAQVLGVLERIARQQDELVTMLRASDYRTGR